MQKLNLIFKHFFLVMQHAHIPIANAIIACHQMFPAQWASKGIKSHENICYVVSKSIFSQHWNVLC